MNITVRPGLRLALTLLFILAVYFQSINHPFSLFDDPNIVDYYGINSTISFLDVITPGGGFYYRPLVNLSYWLDSQVWGMDSTFMHLENIVVHLLNVFLVFLIASRLPVSSEMKSLPILSALIFGLHPINSESVNWIAGRTDVFAGTFVFFSVYCLIRAIQKQSARFAIVAFAIAIIGALVKETAIMFIPAAFLVVMFWPFIPQEVFRYKTWRAYFLLVPLVVSSCIIFLLLVLVYVKGRGNNAISLIFEDKTPVIIRSFEAFGFYVKKLFLPFPLNIAIVEVDPLYAVLGIITLCVLVITFRRAGIPGIFLTISVLFTIPSLLVASTSFTWTPFGERYLYIPSAFVAIACLELSHRFFVRFNAIKWFVPIVSIIVIIASIATIQRGILWGDNVALIEDTIVKSPNFGVIRNQYGSLLKLSGRYEEAKKQYIIASQLNNKENVDRVIRTNLIWLKIQGKPHDVARRILLSEIGNKSNGDVELLKQINKYDEYMLGETTSLKSRKLIVADIIETNKNLYLKTRDPHYLYRSGQLALFVGNKEEAGAFFRKTYENARHDAYYSEPARKLAEQLCKK